MIIDLSGFDFEMTQPSSVEIGSLFDRIRQFLDAKGINRSEYALGCQITAGFGELVIQKRNDFWLVFTTERGKNFDVSIFLNEFHAVNYFIFRLTGDKEMIEWPTI